MKKNVHDVTIECAQGDITHQEDVAAVVNAANAQLRTGGGVAGAIHRTAGPNLAEECRPLAPIEPGKAVITGAYDLPNEYVIHCLGPVYGRDHPEDKLLARCYGEALRLAEERDIARLAFPALSTGAFGYPLEEAAQIALSTVIRETENLYAVELVRFVLFSSEAEQVHKRVLRELID